MPVSIQNITTFSVAASCPELLEITHQEQLADFQKKLLKPHLILGGGSNVLFTRDLGIPVLVVKNQGIQIQAENQTTVWVRVGAGVVWDELVAWTIAQELAGIENLSLIPGRVGAAPVQNIGAYGVEFASVLESVIAWDKAAQQYRQFSAAECQLGYRDSFFKQSGKDRFVIMEVVLRLQRAHSYKPNVTYGAILTELQKLYTEPFTASQVREVVAAIRCSKLPDPKVIGNAGSFFKNPVITATQFLAIQEQFPAVVHYPAGNEVKLAAGWLIEQAGWKGYRKGDAGCHPQQALILVNYGNATGSEILELAQQIQHSVQQQFGVILEPEVNIF